MAKYRFLNWCVEVANSDLTKLETIQSLGEMAIKEGLFDPEENKEVIEFWIQNSALPLKRNVKSIATAISSRKDFYVNIQKKSFQPYHFNQDRCHLGEENILSGQVHLFLSNPPIPSAEECKKQREFYIQLADKEPHRFVDVEGSPIKTKFAKENWVNTMYQNWEDSLRLVPDLPEYDLDLNDLVDRFYESLNQYCLDKKCGIKDLPLRICKLDNCDQVFLGRLKKQEFCKKRHGEIWHGKQAYRKKVLEKKKKERR